MEEDYVSHRTYDLCQRHIDYLNSINPGNHNAALRTSLDRLIQIDKQKNNKQKMDSIKDNVVIIAIGMIFLLFGIVSKELLVIITSLGVGLFFATYGLITIKVKKT